MGDYHSRQSFLGPKLPDVLEHARIAVVGVSGGGSHVVQQLAHIGFQNLALFDPDELEEVNLHRHVGATCDDVGRLKVEVGERVVRGLWPEADVLAARAKWQERVEDLRTVDLIFGCLDGVRSRLDLETTARRYLIPLIDIGLGMRGEVEKLLVGQVATSMPGGPCLRCIGLLSERELAEEAAQSGGYAGFGPAPQVVWANGVLASTAVGVAVDLLTGWNRVASPAPRLQYLGNTGVLEPYGAPVPPVCVHYKDVQLGDPSWS